MNNNKILKKLIVSFLIFLFIFNLQIDRSASAAISIVYGQLYHIYPDLTREQPATSLDTSLLYISSRLSNSDLKNAFNLHSSYGQDQILGFSRDGAAFRLNFFGTQVKINFIKGGSYAGGTRITIDGSEQGIVNLNGARTMVTYVSPILNRGSHYVVAEMHTSDDNTGFVHSIAFYNNVLPGVSVVSPLEDSTFSETDNAFIPSISVSDTDNDNLTCQYFIDSETTPRDTKALSNTAGAQILNFNPIDMNTLDEGNHSLSVKVYDGKPSPVDASCSTSSVNFKVDKTPPVINSTTCTSTASSITVSGSATDGIVGLDPSPYRFTVGASPSTSWMSNGSYTKESLLPNVQYPVMFEARDSKNHIASNTQNIYTKAVVPELAINNPTSYSLDIATGDNNSPITKYQVCLSDYSKYLTQEGALTVSPVWITLPDKSISINGLTPQTTYTFKAKAKNEEGIETEWSAPVSATTLEAPPGSPANIVATADENSVTVSWDPVPGALGYEVEADGAVTDNGTETTYTHSNLTPNTQHTYRIRAMNAGGPGNWSTPVTKSTRPVSPTEPLNINAAATDTKVIVTWEAMPGATGYDIEVDGQVYNNSSSTNYVHTGLLPGTAHSYRVRSINAGGKSNWSSEVLVTTRVGTPSVPYNIETETSKTQIRITWDEVTGATGYDIELDGLIADAGNNTSYTHRNLIPETEHTYRVRAKVSGIGGDWSPMVTASTLLDVFGTPANFKADATDTTVALTWDEVTGATGYDVEADEALLDNGTDTTCIIGGLDPDTSHMYRIRARSDEAPSDWTGYINITTFGMPTPSGISGSSTEDSITVSWNPVPGAESYDLQLDGNYFDETGDTNYTLNDLEPNKQYKISVRAKNADSFSAWSKPYAIATSSGGYTIPSNMFAVIKDTSIRLIWAGAEDANGYDLEVDGTIIEDLSTVEYLHDGLSPGSQHSYRLKIKDGEGEGDWGGTMTVSTLPTGLDIPSNITASSTLNSVLLTWDSVENAEDYDIEVDGQIVENGQGTTYLHSPLSANTAHSYRIRARNASETGQWSDIIKVSTKSSTQDISLDCTEGEVFNLLLTTSNVPASGRLTFTVTYNADELELVDLCGTTPRIDLTAGNIVGTDLQVLQTAPGTIVLSKTFSSSQGQGFSGIVDAIKFKAKVTGLTTVVYSIQ